MGIQVISNPQELLKSDLGNPTDWPRKPGKKASPKVKKEVKAKAKASSDERLPDAPLKSTKAKAKTKAKGSKKD